MSDTIISKRLDGSQLVVETRTGTESYDAKFLVAALLVDIARSGGSIEPEESAKMIELIQEEFGIPGSESLELLTRAVTEMADNPDLGPALVSIAPSFSDAEKEGIALMALKVIAADGRRDVEEMEKFDRAVDVIGMSPETVHRAFSRYFEETMPGS